jgi:hypothetical protein
MEWKNRIKEIEKKYDSISDKKRMQELAGIKPNISPNILKFEEDLKNFIEDLKASNPSNLEENDDEESGEFSKLLDKINKAKIIIQKQTPGMYEYWENLFNHNLNALFQENISEEEEQYIFDSIQNHINQLEDFFQTKF